MSIRGPEGTILSPEEQLQALLDHSTRKFCHGDPYISEHRMTMDFTVTEQEVERLISKTPLRKAVPESVAPSAVWKLCAESVSQVIVHALRSCWGAEMPALIPQHWKDSQLVWIAKPNKDPSKPQGYRPIGLSHPLAKSLNKLVRERLRPYLESKLQHLPQFAYTNGRGVLDALLRVHSHLRNARLLSLQGRASIYELHQGRRANPCVGGLSFSLDLEGAFDSVPRPKLAESLRRLTAPEDLIHLAMEFYSDARYHTRVGEHKGHVTTTCGIKQGCTLAPYLFVAHTLAILEDIQARVGGDWVQTCVTFFADDALGCWNIHSLSELRKAFADIQAIIDVFNEQGMTLSNDKSVVLYDLRGRDAGKFLARRKVRKHQQQHFHFHQRGQDLWVPIKKSHEYLGTIIAYRDAQSKTVTHRLKKARGQYSQLRKTINSARIVSNRPRYHVWRAGVLSAATYGLLSVGVTGASKRSLQAMASRQMRAIARRPAHVSHLTNAQVRQALNAEEPLAALHAQGEKYLQKLNEVARLQPDDIRGQESSRQQLEYALSTLLPEPEPPTGGMPTEAPEAGRFQCQQCHKKYDSLTSLKKHMAISHKVKFTQCVDFDPARHAIGNLPQFDTWHALKQHIQRLNCQILMQQVGLTGAVAPGASLEVRPSVAGRQPGHEDPDIQTCVEKNGWTALLDSPHAQHFRQHCSLCNRWIKDPTALKRHLKQTHGDLWDSVAPALEAKCAEVKQQLTRDGTCPWCERTSYSRHYHQCNVIFQSALLGLLHDRQRDGRLRELATGPNGPTRTTRDNGSEAAPREQLSGRTTQQEGQANKTGRPGSRPKPRQEQIGNVVTMLASLCLQQEDALNRIRLETSHTLHLAQQGQGAVLKALYNAGTAWQVKKNSGEPVQALRVVLFGLLLAETQARIQLFSKDDAAVKAAQANHILDKGKRFVYQKWDAQASKLVTDPDKKGLTLEEVMAILTELRKLSNDQIITKFNASRRLRKEPDNDEKAVFTVEVAMRSPPANRIQGLLDQMTDNAAWGLVAAQLRPPNLKRRGLASAIPKALEAD